MNKKIDYTHAIVITQKRSMLSYDFIRCTSKKRAKKWLKANSYKYKENRYIKRLTNICLEAKIVSF